MNKCCELKELISKSFDKMTDIYGKGNEEMQIERYKKAVDEFFNLYGDMENVMIFSAPGRTEICGNHTDHNLGKVVAGSVNLDVIAVVGTDNSDVIEIKSEGYPKDTISIDDLEVKDEEENTSSSLIRGMAYSFKEKGYKIGGFKAYATSNVLKGSGLSSSAAYEVLIGTILNGAYNDGKVSAVEIAKMAQFAENVYFKKPCGLMDQMASSVGGIISIDFEDKNNPIIEKIDFDFSCAGHALCILDTGGNHADLTNEYASIPQEMKNVAEYFGKSVLREIKREDVLENIQTLREKFGDRAVLRCLHYFDENENVDVLSNALKEKDFDTFLKVNKKSGNSSFRFLQNVYANINPAEQGISLAIYVAENILKDKGSYRVHGGGFGGTTQNFVPENMVSEFKEKTEKIFGKDKCHILNIRKYGGIKVF